MLQENYLQKVNFPFSSNVNRKHEAFNAKNAQVATRTTSPLILNADKSPFCFSDESNNLNDSDNVDDSYKTYNYKIRYSDVVLDGVQRVGALSKSRNALESLLKRLSFSFSPRDKNDEFCASPLEPLDDLTQGGYGSERTVADLDNLESYASSAYGNSPFYYYYYDYEPDKPKVIKDYGSAPYILRHASYGNAVEADTSRTPLNNWSCAKSGSSSTTFSSTLSLFTRISNTPASSSAAANNFHASALLAQGDSFYSDPQRRATCAIIDSTGVRTICLSPTLGQHKAKLLLSNDSKSNARNVADAMAGVTPVRARALTSTCGCNAKRQLAFGANYCCGTPRVPPPLRSRAASALSVLSPSAKSRANNHAYCNDSLVGIVGNLSNANNSQFPAKNAAIPLDKTGQRSSSHYTLQPVASATTTTAPPSSDDVPPLAFSAPASGSFHAFSLINGAACHNEHSIFNFGATLQASNTANIDDDREIDNRSVMHYELGFYEKTFATNCFRGTLTFQLRYDFIHRVLMLHVMRATNLPTQEDPPDPYVKMYCLPERRHHCKTRIFKRSANAAFNEMFSFDVPYNQLADRMLQFTVYNFDRFTRHGLIGNVIMRDLFEKSDLCNWTEYVMQIVGNQEKNDYGDLLIYLAYSLQLKRLFVTVSKAYNLRPMDITGASDPYVKVEQIFQRKRLKCRKTSIKRANLNPVYHECLEFDIAPEHLDKTNLLFQVMDWDRIGRDDLLGCCVLGRESTTRQGRQQWEQLCQTALRPFSPITLLPLRQQQQLQQKRPQMEKRENDDNKEVKDANNNHNENSMEPIVMRQKSIQENDAAHLARNSQENGQATRRNGTQENAHNTHGNRHENGDQNSRPKSPLPIIAGKCVGNGHEKVRARAIGTWHSILGEVPETFRNIPKAKK